MKTETCCGKWNAFLNETLIVSIQLQGILDYDSLISGLFYSLHRATMTELHFINFMCLQYRDHV